MGIAEELMAKRSPNMSGVPTQDILKALAQDARVTNPHTSYAFGMNVEDAQREAQLGQQAAQQRMDNVSALQKQAIAQDAQAHDSALKARQIALAEEAQRIDSAMKAHSRYIAERNLAMQERVTEAELAYKNALQGRAAYDIETAKLNNQKLLMQMQQEDVIDKTTIKFPDFTNPGKFIDMPVRVLMGAGGSAITRYLSGTEGKGKETSTDRMFKARTTTWLNQGLSPEGAAYLAATKPESVRAQIERLVDADEKALKPKYGKINYGNSGVDAEGKPIPKTRDEYRQGKVNELIDSFYRGLSPEDRNILKGLKVMPPDGEAFEAPTENTNDPLASIDIEKLAEAIAAHYQ